jgi:hypothetical protein
MAYVRLDDSVMDNPKMVALSDRAFRGWVWGLCYAQRHLTDGYLPLAALTATTKRAAGELQARGLWTVADAGFQIHDYLKHQDSKIEVEERKLQARKRMQDRRSLKDRRAHEQSVSVRENFASTHSEPPLPLPSSYRSSEGVQGEVGDRAARLLQELYPDWYAKYRRGARLRLVSNTLAYQDARTICETWDDARIAQLAQVFLTTDDEWISRTDRGFRVFAAKATWADDRLKQAEAATV